MKKTTLKDIALELGVSVSTVSRALQNNSRISIEIRNKVFQIAKKSNYFRDKYPHLLSLNKGKLIGVIVPKISYHLYAMAVSGIEKVAEDHGMRIIICQSDESHERELDLVRELSAIGVVGLIVSLAAETRKFDHFLELNKKGIPLVFFNRLCPEVKADKVVIDNHKAAMDATEHLISIGCKRIAFIGGPNFLQISNTRLKGYQSALNKHGYEYHDASVVHTNFSREGNLSAARKLLYSPAYPDGILAFSDQVAIAAMMAAKERGIKIPEDISIIGFNNEPVAELLEPSLSSIDQPAYQMGIESAQLIMQRVQNPFLETSNKILHAELIIRNSTNKNKTKL